MTRECRCRIVKLRCTWDPVIQRRVGWQTNAVGIGQNVLRMIEDVEGVGPELDLKLLPDAETLRHAGVEIVDRWAEYVVSARPGINARSAADVLCARVVRQVGYSLRQ